MKDMLTAECQQNKNESLLNNDVFIGRQRSKTCRVNFVITLQTLVPLLTKGLYHKPGTKRTPRGFSKPSMFQHVLVYRFFLLIEDSLLGSFQEGFVPPGPVVGEAAGAERDFVKSGGIGKLHLEGVVGFFASSEVENTTWETLIFFFPLCENFGD
jgi:hypothetical protein